MLVIGKWIHGRSAWFLRCWLSHAVRVCLLSASLYATPLFSLPSVSLSSSPSIASSNVGKQYPGDICYVREGEPLLNPFFVLYFPCIAAVENIAIPTGSTVDGIRFSSVATCPWTRLLGVLLPFNARHVIHPYPFEVAFLDTLCSDMTYFFKLSTASKCLLQLADDDPT